MRRSERLIVEVENGPHPNLPPAKLGEGVYIPSPTFSGGGLGWGRLRYCSCSNPV